MSTRAYKNFKHNSNTKKKRSISPEYLEHRFKRGGGSLKTAYCDEDDDGVVASTFALKRSPAVYKGATCEMVYDVPPESGPENLSATVLAPAAGPENLSATVFTPAIPVGGPSDLTVELIAPADGPTNLNATHLIQPTVALDDFILSFINVVFGTSQRAQTAYWPNAPWINEVHFKNYTSESDASVFAGYYNVVYSNNQGAGFYYSSPKVYNYNFNAKVDRASFLTAHPEYSSDPAMVSGTDVYSTDYGTSDGVGTWKPITNLPW